VEGIMGLNDDISGFARAMVAEIEALIPRFNAVPEDFAIGGGNVAVMIIGPRGDYYGKIFGPEPSRARGSSQIAWKKATQAWMTGMATGEFEKKVYSGEVDDSGFGIMRPDFIGWEGGFPAKTKEGVPIALGFSGYRGEDDIKILELALAALGGSRA
jgi:uncharacterized protein GlcG (DUF336 family)